jgi:hypothetical protein
VACGRHLSEGVQSGPFTKEILLTSFGQNLAPLVVQIDDYVKEASKPAELRRDGEG